jgi:Uma2 family endonuclease
MRTAARKLTYGDYEMMPADGFRHELIDGAELMTPAPNPDHQAVVVNLTALLHARARRLGHVFVAPTDVVLSEHDLVQPDLLFVTKTRAHLIGAKNIEGAPDLVIEVLSPSTETVDRVQKLGLYDRSGVREYWVVDPASKTVQIHEFGSPRRTRVYKEGQSFESAVLPELTVALADIF